MNDGNSKFRKNPFPWLALMSVYSVAIAMACGYVGGCIARGDAEEALKDDRLKAKLALQAAAELEAKKTIELQKLEQREKKFEAERRQLLAQRSKDRATIDSARKANRKRVAVKSEKPVPKDYQLNAKLVKKQDTGRSIFDIKAAQKDNWHDWKAEVHMINTSGELVTVRVNVGDLSVLDSKAYKVVLRSIDKPGKNLLKYIRENLQKSSGSYSQWNNGDLCSRGQLLVYIPLGEVNKYISLVHE